MPSWDWLSYVELIGPLWCVITALVLLARLLGSNESRIAAVAAICMIAVPVTAVAYLVVTGWRPTLQHLFIYVFSTVVSEILADRLDRRLGQRSADMTQSGRDVNRALRSELTTLGLVIAITAVGLWIIHPVFSLVLVAATSLWTLLWLPPAMRRVESGVAVLVTCRPERAFDFVSDARNQPHYVAEVESVDRLTLGSPHIGSRVRVHHWDDSLAVEEILEYDRPRRLAVGLPDALQANRSIWTFEPAPVGTRVRYAYRYQMNVAEALAGGRLADGLQRPRRNAWRCAFLERLKAMLEAPETEVVDEWMG
ncbi:MAG TPA: SRPBCC family protein [Candidatus Eisenbacteria bacterium]|nr:SRPBCC family protein [Candidatus Eisenbacteria bacterium]